MIVTTLFFFCCRSGCLEDKQKPVWTSLPVLLIRPLRAKHQFLSYNTIPVEFFCIWTLIWSISLCKKHSYKSVKGGWIAGPSCRYKSKSLDVWGHNNFLIQPWPSSCWPAHRMGIYSNPLINGLIQHTFKVNFVFVEFPVMLSLFCSLQ